jgi:hypothetical protein
VLKAKDALRSAHTMEFGYPTYSNVVLIPAGMAQRGTLPDGGEGMGYTTKYNMLGANADGMDIIVDGMNDQGLSIGLLYFRGSPNMPKLRPATPPAPWRRTNSAIGCSAICERRGGEGRARRFGARSNARARAQCSATAAFHRFRPQRQIHRHRAYRRRAQGL